MSTRTIQLTETITYENIADISETLNKKCLSFDPSRPYHVMEIIYFQEIP